MKTRDRSRVGVPTGSYKRKGSLRVVLDYGRLTYLLALLVFDFGLKYKKLSKKLARLIKFKKIVNNLEKVN